VEGVDRLHGATHAVLPDRIEAGTYAMAAAMTGGDVLLAGARADLLQSALDAVASAGARITSEAGGVRVHRNGNGLEPVDVTTDPFPGFPTDLQAAFAVLMTQSEGVSKIHERVFDDRLRYTDQLRAMGADIAVPRFVAIDDDGHPIPGAIRYGTRAEITGPSTLTGRAVRCLDIRAGAGVVLAGLTASGETVVSALHHLDRGYEGFVDKLRDLGASVEESTADPSELAATV